LRSRTNRAADKTLQDIGEGEFYGYFVQRKVKENMRKFGCRETKYGEKGKS
jgi:hypothetical protein